MEAIRLLRVTRTTAVKARTQAMNALHAAVLAAPDELREQLRLLGGRTLITRCARLRPETTELVTLLEQPDRLGLAAAKTALCDLAARWSALDAEATRLKRQLTELISRVAPELIALQGVGSEVAGQLLITVGELLITVGDNADRITGEASFAKLRGVCPQPASSGKTTGRHRLSRGGDRDANSALYMIAVPGCVVTNQPAPTPPAAPPKGCPNVRSCAASSATSPAKSSPPYRHQQPAPPPSRRSISLLDEHRSIGRLMAAVQGVVVSRVEAAVAHLRSMAVDDRLPAWPLWWSPEDFAQMVPDVELRAELIADCAQLLLGLFTGPMLDG